MPHRSSSHSRSSSSSSSSSSPSSSSESYRKRKSRHSRHKHKKRSSKKSSKKSGRRRSPSSSPDRRRRRSSSSNERYRRSSPRRGRKKSPSPLRRKAQRSPPPKRVEETPVIISEGDRLKRNKEIERINNDSFHQGEFSSSSAMKAYSHQESLKKTTQGSEFGFGTMVEKKVLKNIDSEGLCHPKLFAESDLREEKWLTRLFRLRKELMSETAKDSI